MWATLSDIHVKVNGCVMLRIRLNIPIPHYLNVSIPPCMDMWDADRMGRRNDTRIGLDEGGDGTGSCGTEGIRRVIKAAVHSNT